MLQLKWWALLCLAACLLSARTASAQQGCEYTSAIDFFEKVIEPNSDCRWLDNREVYQCQRQGAPEWELKIFSPQPGDGRTTAYRDDGFAVIYGCTCDNACAFYSTAALWGRAEPVDANKWICTGDADRYNAFSEDLWGATCTSQGAMFAQAQGYTQYDPDFETGKSTWWVFVGNDGDPACRGRLDCSVRLQEPGGPPREYHYGPGDHGFTVDYIVQSLQLECICEQ